MAFATKYGRYRFYFIEKLTGICYVMFNRKDIRGIR